MKADFKGMRRKEMTPDGADNDYATSRGSVWDNGQTAIARGQQLVNGVLGICDNDQVVDITGRLIAVYNGLHNDRNLRDAAAELVVKFAARYETVLDLVIQNAKAYASLMYVDDADPYTPNSFDVLLKLANPSEQVLSFLELTIQNDWGIPRWDAIRVLCELRHPRAEHILREIIQGHYPPAFLELDSDIRVIESARGRDFLTTLQKSSP